MYCFQASFQSRGGLAFKIGPGNFWWPLLVIHQKFPDSLDKILTNFWWPFSVIHYKFLIFLGKNHMIYRITKNHKYHPFLTSTLPAQLGQTLKKFRNHLFTHKNQPFLLLPYRPTGHCPNALVASQPLFQSVKASGWKYESHGHLAVATFA